MRTELRLCLLSCLCFTLSCGEEPPASAPALVLRGELIDAGPAAGQAPALRPETQSKTQLKTQSETESKTEAASDRSSDEAGASQALGYGSWRGAESVLPPTPSPTSTPQKGQVAAADADSAPLDPAAAAATPAAASALEELLSKPLLKFSDLALGEQAVNLLLDSLMAIDDFPQEDFEFPERIKGLDGHEIALLGYMIPTRWEGAKVQSFMLVGDMLSCCFGGSPQADQWLDVTMEGEGTKYLPYVPIVVKGRFHLTSEMPESGYFIGVYQMDATSVEARE